MNIRSDKKGLMALEALVGVILSTLALFFMFQVFSNLFLSTPNNLKIAEDNIQSIKEFIEYSENSYGSFNDCFTLLKLKNLENFQYAEEKNFFYLLDSKGVYIFDIKYLNIIYDDKIYSNSHRKKYEKFEAGGNDLKLNLKKDETEIGFDKFSFDIYGYSLGTSSNKIEVSNANFLILIPQFNKDFFGYETSFIEDNQNMFVGEVYNGDFEISKGNYLVYKPGSKDLFLSNSELTNTFAKVNNCALMKNLKAEKLKYLSNKIDEVDYFNNEIYFDFVTENGIQKNFQFVWNINDIKCPQNEGKTCEEYLGRDYNEFSYDLFLENIQKIYINKFSESGTLRIVKLREFTLDEVKKINTNEEKYLNYRYILEYNKRIELTDDVEESLENILDNGEVLFNNYREKAQYLCEEEICDYAIFSGGHVYFFDYKQEKFITINPAYLRRDGEGNVYFQGEISKAKEISFYDGIIWGLRDEYKFYTFLISTKDGFRNIALSEQQYKALPVIS